MVVWLKTPIPVDSTTGVLTGDSRRRVEEFVRGTFEDRLARDVGERDRVVWFKNWTQLQSVRGLEHIHVLVRDVPEKVMNEWTGEVRLDN